MHLEKAVVCPVCRNDKKKFRTSADAVLHLESGYCSGCRVTDNAMKAVYGFLQKNAPGSAAVVRQQASPCEGITTFINMLVFIYKTCYKLCNSVY